MENWGNKMSDKKSAKRIKILESALNEFGEHKDSCGLIQRSSECTCGLSDILEDKKFYITQIFSFWESQDECHEMEIVSLDGNTGIARSLRDGGRYDFIINDKDCIVVQN